MLVCLATVALWALAKFKLLDGTGSVLVISDISMVFTSGILFVCCLVYFWPFGKGREDTPGAIGSKTAGSNAKHNEQTALQAEVVINAIDDGVVSLNGKGNITLINPAAAKLIGWTGGDAASLNYKSVLKMVDAKDQPVPDASDPILATLNTNTTTETNNFSFVTGSGKRLMVSLVVSPVGDVGSGAIVVFRDITRAKTEEKEQAEFISTASHEMRTPVASIEGYLGLALNPNTAQIDSKARDFIEKAHASAQHLGRLFQDLLDVTKADDGRIGNHPKVVDVVDYIGDIVEGLKPKADEKGLQISYIPRPLDGSTSSGVKTLAPVYYANVDNDHLREVVANLVENAIKYTPKGQVTIDVGGDEDHIDISVKDSGIGIPAEDIPHLFQKFYRVDNSDTREIGGTGLGLYLCRRLAEVMGGRIDLASEFKKGSTFTLEIPRIERTKALQLMEQQKLDDAKEAAAAPATPIPSAFTPPQPAAAQPVVQASPQPAPASPAPVAVAAPAAAPPAPSQQQPVVQQQPQPVQVAPQPAPPSVFQPQMPVAQPVQLPPQPTVAPQTLPQPARPVAPMQVPGRTEPPQNPPAV